MEGVEEVRDALRARLSENGWRWRDAETEKRWSFRIAVRVSYALLDPDGEVATRAAHEAFVDGLEDAARRGDVVEVGRSAGSWWERVRRLRDAIA